MRTKIVLLMGLALSQFLPTLIAAPLVKDGKPLGEFVLPEDPAGAELYGSSDVRDLIAEITGAKVPVLNKASASKNEKVFIGTSFAGEFKEDLAKLGGNDGFAVRRKGDHVYVFGSRPRGTLFGLYSLLEKNTDLIFARPDEVIGTVFGETSDLTLSETDFIDIPVFRTRVLAPGWPRHRPTGIWLLRNRDMRRDIRANYKGFTELDLDEAYNTHFSVPLTEHIETHPEYFAYDPIKKARRFVRHGEGTMCLSIPGLPAIWAKGLADRVAAHEKRFGRKVDSVRIGPGDNWYCCECEKCLAPITLEDGSKLACKDPDSIKDPQFRSTQIFKFLNEAMPTWLELRPDIPLHVLAYIHFAEPPLVDLHPALGVYFAPYPTDNMHYPLLDERQRDPWRRRFERWLEMSPNLGMYGYLYSKPSPLGFAVAENLRALMRNPDHQNAIIYAEMDNDVGAKGIGTNKLGWDVALMNAWVINRLFWDPTQDVDALYRYYIKRTFREGAPQMLAYFDLIKSSWLDPENKTVDAAHASIAGVYEGLIVKPGLEPKCFELLRAAEKAAVHPHSKMMIHRMLAQYTGFSKKLARLVVANIPELAADTGDFDSIQWQKPEPCEDFMITTRSTTVELPSESTLIRAAHDGKNLHLRFTVKGSAGSSQPADVGEHWPKGEHLEFWLFSGRDRYVFALSGNGTIYDAKNLDRSWDSGWAVKFRKGDSGWEALAVIPMSTFGFEAGKETHWSWFATRETSSGEEFSYQGKPLFYKKFPVMIQ
ncbi:DUF4838 domain-containing protein [Verrucomicrobiaceae bacterium 227]